MAIYIGGTNISDVMLGNMQVNSLWLGPTKIWSSKELLQGDGVYMFGADWFVVYANSSEVLVMKATNVGTGLNFGNYQYLSGGINSSIQSYYNGLTDTTTKSFLVPITVKNEYYYLGNTSLSYYDSASATQYMYAVSADEWHNNNGANASSVAVNTWGIGVSFSYTSTRTGHQTSRSTACRPHCIFGVGEDVDYYHGTNGGAYDGTGLRSAQPCARLDLTKCKLKWNNASQRWIPIATGPIPEDPFKYDVTIDMPSSNELDFLYTSDIHVGWKDWGSNRWGSDYKVFSLNKDQTTGNSLVGGDVKAYQNKLVAANIPTYLLDCGDWSKTSDYEDVDTMVNTLIGMDYLGITYGNWEFKWNPMSTAVSTMNRLIGHGLMATTFNDASWNMVYTGNVLHGFPGCKTIKVGDKKIALIAIGYPSPNGFDTYGNYSSGGKVEYNVEATRWNYKEDGETTTYRFRDAENDASAHQSRIASHTLPGSLYGFVQDYVTALKGTYGFDYVIGFGHMDKYSEENYSQDSRFYSRADFLIMNTIGLDAFIPGHLNSPVAATSTYVNKDGSGTGIVAPTCGGNMNSFGRMRIDLTKSGSTGITCTLLQSLSDLTV